MLIRFSSAMASRISRSLRALSWAVASTASCGLSAESRSTLRTYCMVSVEAPCDTPPACWLATNARTVPLRSTPWCSKKRESSAATIALRTSGDIWLIGMYLRSSS